MGFFSDLVIKGPVLVRRPHGLYKEGDLKFPFPELAIANAKSRAAYA
jgi:hypothetical protein